MKKRVLYAFYAFLLSILAFCLFLTMYGVLGYGNYTILRGDLVAQYIDFISMYVRVLKGQEDFWYSFSLFYGSGTILTFAYYAFSPFNLLFLIDAIPVATMMTIVITLKIGLAGFTFSLFAQSVLKCKAHYSVFFALCYALNGFAVTLHFNLIWLEAIYMLPLLVWLLFRLVDTGKWLALVPVWAFLFITNFYMAYIVGVFSVFVFAGILLLRLPAFSKAELKRIGAPVLRFTFSVILAAALSAAILVPTAMFLLSHMAADNFGFEPLPTSLFDVIGSLFIGEMPDIDNRAPFLYCGIPVLLLIPFYFLQKKISLRERLITASVLIFYILSILVLPLFVFMHAFDYPNWYYFRFTFCICFALCAIACRTAELALAELPVSKVLAYAALLLIFYSFMIGYGPLNADSDDVTNTSRELAINLLFMTLWLLVLVLLQKKFQKSIHRYLSAITAFLLLIAELALNGSLCMSHIGLTPESEEEFNSWYQSEKNALSGIPANETDLYRVAMYGEGNCNAPAFWGYAGFNTFSSSDAYELRQALNGLGIAGGNRYLDELGYTDVTRMLFGVKYIGSVIKPDQDISYRESSLSEFPYYLPFAYMISNSITDYAASEDPFENQEHLVQCMTDHSYHFFDRLTLEDIELSSFNADMQQLNDYTVFRRRSSFVPTAGVYFTAPQKENQPFYMCFRQEHPSADLSAPYVVGSKECFSIASTLSYGSIYKGNTFDGSFGNKAETVAVFFQDGSKDEYPCRQLYFSYFNGNDMDTARNDLSSGAMKITEHRGGYLHGTVTVAPERPILFTSIPYEQGWQAIVDGVSTNVSSVLDEAFIALPLTPGPHEITLKYIAPGSKIGLIISVISAFVYLLFFVYFFKKGYKKK